MSLACKQWANIANYLVGAAAPSSSNRDFPKPLGRPVIITTIQYVSYIRIGVKRIMKKTLNVFRLLLGGSKFPVNPCHCEVLKDFFMWIHC
jgi:hypothetical protein